MGRRGQVLVSFVQHLKKFATLKTDNNNKNNNNWRKKSVDRRKRFDKLFILFANKTKKNKNDIFSDKETTATKKKKR